MQKLSKPKLVKYKLCEIIHMRFKKMYLIYCPFDNKFIHSR